MTGRDRTAAGNLLGIGIMAFAMFCFAIEDAIIKILGTRLSAGQILMILGCVMALFFGAMTRRQGDPLLDPRLLSKPVAWRMLGELVGTACFVTAIIASPIVIASAIIQASPLLVTMGAALVLREPVGWRRWVAIAVGLVGVLVILRPWSAAFEPMSLFAVVGVTGLSVRDIATRRIDDGISTMALATWGVLMTIPAGLILLVFDPRLGVPVVTDWAILGMGVVMGMGGYYAITAAMRVGEVAVVTPFRYTRLVFALPIGILLFNEDFDTWSILGALIVVGSGLFVLWRETQTRSS